MRDMVFSPKRLQKEGKFKEAIEYYQKRYSEVLDQGDSYLSSLYLDEIAYTLIIGNRANSYEQLHHELVKITGIDTLVQEKQEQATLDIQLTLRKRFPERFEKSDSDELHQ